MRCQTPYSRYGKRAWIWDCAEVMEQLDRIEAWQKRRVRMDTICLEEMCKGV
jgi:hypothetical protein